MSETRTRIFVAGHRGLVGSALSRFLGQRDDCCVFTIDRDSLDLRDAGAVDRYFDEIKPEHVYLAAAQVGGIAANIARPAEFIRNNLAIQLNVIDAARRHGVARLLFLGSSCIYPKLAPQPLNEAALLTGPLEPSNRPYAIAKIAGIEMCWSYNRQYGTKFVAAMPSNVYGPGDNYDPQSSHVIPALIRKFHDAKIRSEHSVTIWGTGSPRREFIYSEDLADACHLVMTLPEGQFTSLLLSHQDDLGLFHPPTFNVGVGEDISIRELAQLVQRVVGFTGSIEFDARMPDGTPRKLLDSSVMRSLGWSAKVKLEDGLHRAYAAFLADPPAR